MTRRWVPVFCVVLIGLCGCGSLPKPSVEGDSVEHKRLLYDFENRNASLTTFKGVGRANLRRDEKEYAVRLAWAGAEPGRLRVEMIGAPGLPKMGFSTDGEWVYYLDPDDAEDPVKKISSQNPNLKHFLSLPVTAAEIVSFLSGRIPEYAPQRVRLRNRPDDDGYVLVLEKPWWQGVRQEIFLDSGKTEIRKIESYKAGLLAYRVAFLKMQSIRGYRLPSVLMISDDQGRSFRLTIDRYWPNADLSPDLFVLKAPAKSQ